MTAHLTLVPRRDASDETPAECLRASEPDMQWVHDSWVPPASPPATPWARVSRRLRAALQNERGAVTAEYAIVIMAAVAFAGLLVAIMRSGEIRAMLVQLVESALSAAG